MNHGKCIPCSEYCNGHAHLCLKKFDTEPIDTLSIINGPLSDAYCINCMDNTTGPTCSGCLSGHFRGSNDYRDPCRQVPYSIQTNAIEMLAFNVTKYELF